MIHFDTSERIVGTISSGYVILKMTIFTDFVDHVGMVVWDAGLAGVAGLLVVHYGKKILACIDKAVSKRYYKRFKK